MERIQRRHWAVRKEKPAQKGKLFFADASSTEIKGEPLVGERRKRNNRGVGEICIDRQRFGREIVRVDYRRGWWGGMGGQGAQGRGVDLHGLIPTAACPVVVGVLEKPSPSRPHGTHLCRHQPRTEVGILRVSQPLSLGLCPQFPLQLVQFQDRLQFHLSHFLSCCKLIPLGIDPLPTVLIAVTVI